MAMIVMVNDELVAFLILKFAIAISKDTNKKVILPNSKIRRSPPAKMSREDIIAMVIIAIYGMRFFLFANRLGK